MKKVLLLGAMAFFAINIANAQTNLTSANSEEAIKLQKEQQLNVSEQQKLNQMNQAATPKKQSATKQNTSTSKNVRPVNTNNAEVAPNTPAEAAATNPTAPKDQPTSPKVKPAPEKTDTPQTVGRKKPNFVKPSNANNNKLHVKQNAGSQPISKSVVPSSMKPKHPANPRIQSNESNEKTNK